MGAALAAGAAVYRTAADIKPVPENLFHLTGDIQKPVLTDRYGTLLTVTYTNPWNSTGLIPLHEVPERLKELFLLSEDKRFYSHGGVDWPARCHALWQNITAGRAVRGASTITEQVVRMIHPRPRTVWSRWIEGFEAAALERQNSKAAILGFYLNQVPYGSNRRGIAQAASYYFNRSPDSLNLKEMMALAVLVRAPSYFDLYRNPGAIQGALDRFAGLLYWKNRLTNQELTRVTGQVFQLERANIPVNAGHFSRFVLSGLSAAAASSPSTIRTTLDGPLQTRVENILKNILASLSSRRVANAACLVSDHRTGEVLAWVSLGLGRGKQSGSCINAPLVPRQPGSAMKPFLYSLALDKGWTGATPIDDLPLTNPVGHGLHTYRNYSRRHYGRISLRQALANSLNIPAVRAIRFTGVDDYLGLLHSLNFASLQNHPDYYSDGLALGNGEVTLYELIRGYNCLANRGIFQPLSVTLDDPVRFDGKRLFSEPSASLIGNILSDPEARSLEFARGSLLDFPIQTAVKTGTSSDYRDAWAIGYNHHHTAGVWMGNLNARTMDGITGSTGPALALRTIFAELNKTMEPRPLFLSPILVKYESPVILETGTANGNGEEWFVPGSEPVPGMIRQPREEIRFLKPVNGLEMAMDPRIPDDNEAFEFVIAGVGDGDTVSWSLDGGEIGTTKGGSYLWALTKGEHRVKAKIVQQGNPFPIYDEARFIVR